MGFKSVVHCAAAIAVACWTTACVYTPPRYTGPGCLVHIYTLPNLQGYELPIVKGTPELNATWHKMAASAKVIYGTWRLFSDADYKGFMGDYKAPTDILQLMPARELSSLQCIEPEPSPPPGY
jgi:Beta/Gamma crystallin